jgi:uncharacterized protein (TIGR03089 family)
MTTVTKLINDWLSEQVRRHGSAPLLTYYDLGSGERTELSAISFRNWVDKTSNLLVDELDVTDGDGVAMPLAVEAPGHWLTFVWEMACWQVGAAVDVAGVAEHSVAVTGRNVAPGLAESRVGRRVLACALHPLGLGFTDALPPGVLDYGVEVRAQPDTYAGSPPGPDAPAWVDPQRTLTQADLVLLDGSPARRLVRPADPWTTCRAGLLTALATGGSSVLIVGDDEERLAQIIASERISG